MNRLVFVSFDQHPDYKKHKKFAYEHGLEFKNRTSSSLEEIKFCAKHKTIVLPQLLVLDKGKCVCRYEFWPSEETLEAVQNGDFSLVGVENPCYVSSLR